MKASAVLHWVRLVRVNAVTLAWFFIAILFVSRAMFVPTFELALFYDEAYYHFWSLTPDWGYYSKPPMVAWLIAATTKLMGTHAEWAVKLGAPLCYLGTTLVIYRTGRKVFSQSAALYAALIFCTTPLVTFNSLFITTDAPLLLFWALTLYLFVVALDTNKIEIWLLAGLAGGLGLLSKYTMGVIAFGFLTFLLVTPSYRKMLGQPGIWLAATVAALVFLPNLVWNWQHDFISFQHTAEISKLNQQLLHPERLLEFFAGQFLVFGPIAMGLLIRVMIKPPQGDSQKLMMVLSTIMLGVICLQALLSRAFVNWAAPAYVSASLLVGYWLALHQKQKLAFWLIVLNMMMGALLYAYPSLQAAVGVDVTRKNTPYHRVMGWRELIRSIPADLHDANTVWLSDSRSLLSYLHYYLSDFEREHRIRLMSFAPDGRVLSQYDLKYALGELDGRSGNASFLFIAEEPQVLTDSFEEVTLVKMIEFNVSPSLKREAYIYSVKGYKKDEHRH